MFLEPTYDSLRALFLERGGSGYGGEAVTQWEHASQAALLAEGTGASAALVIAALLHDVGHLLHDLPADAPGRGIDDVHESLGADWLALAWPDTVVAPVRLHVPAKRYLCAVDPDYLAGLSAPSLLSLRLQGGAFTAEEAAGFESLPHAEDAVRLRRWDDAAKVRGGPVAAFDHFRRHFDAVFSGGRR